MDICIILIIYYVLCFTNTVRFCAGAPYHFKSIPHSWITDSTRRELRVKPHARYSKEIQEINLALKKNSNKSEITEGRGLEFIHSRWWPGGKIPYAFDSSFPQDHKEMVISEMMRIEQAAISSTSVSPPCVRFVERTDEVYFLRIFQGPGCQAAIGHQGVQGQNMSLGQGCVTRGTILHELMHVLGFYHEQNRPDRNNFVTVDFANIAKENVVDFKVFPSHIIKTFGLPYDFGSITHYGPYQKALSPELPVIRPINALGKDVLMGQRDNLSSYDILKIRKAYNCSGDVFSSVFIQSQTTDYIVNCHFSKDTCNMRPGTISKTQWVVVNGPVLNGPQAGHSTGIDPFLVARDDTTDSSARITTPLSRGGPICLDFYLFQKGPSSYLDIVASGSSVKFVTVRSFRRENANFWRRVQILVTVEQSVKVQMTLVAYVTVGAVAIDDFRMHTGKCGG